jgi:hypothetical protein
MSEAGSVYLQPDFLHPRLIVSIDFHQSSAHLWTRLRAQSFQAIEHDIGGAIPYVTLFHTAGSQGDDLDMN